MHIKKTYLKQRNSIKPFIKTNDFRRAEVGSRLKTLSSPLHPYNPAFLLEDKSLYSLRFEPESTQLRIIL